MMFQTAVFLACLLGVAAQGGILKGIALENLTGFPLARTRITLLRLEGDRLRPITQIVSGRDGQFQFNNLDEGYYQLSGVRAGFAEVRLGQRRYGGPGAPVLVPREGQQVVELRLKRLGIVTGRTLDENRVGLPGVPVSAYTVTVPMRIVGSATSDDLGVYRITGLPLGKYLIRTGAAQLDEGFKLMPTYHPFASVMVRDARPVVVELDAESTDIDLQPVPGNLVSLEIAVTGCFGMAQVTLSSETGRRLMQASCTGEPSIVFNALAPGEYEVVAEGFTERKEKVARFTSLYVDLGRPTRAGLILSPLGDLRIRMNETSAALPLGGAGLVLRRRDLAGEGPEVAVTSDRMPLLPGYWQITARPPGAYFLAEVNVLGGGSRGRRREPSPDWFEFVMDPSTQATVTLSPQAAQISGRVSLSGKGAVAAPVYLLATNAEARRRMNGPRVVQTDVNGNYRFEGVAPGTYLILSSFDLVEVSEETMLAGRAVAVTLEEGRKLTQDLNVSEVP